MRRSWQIQSKAFKNSVRIAAQNSLVITCNFHFFYRDWKGMLSIKAFTQTILVFWKNIIKVIVYLTIEASFWNIRKNTHWSVVWFICSTIIFIKWTNFRFFDACYEISLGYRVINAFVYKFGKKITEFL